jgi:hypothetical protein
VASIVVDETGRYRQCFYSIVGSRGRLGPLGTFLNSFLRPRIYNRFGVALHHHVSAKRRPGPLWTRSAGAVSNPRSAICSHPTVEFQQWRRLRGLPWPTPADGAASTPAGANGQRARLSGQLRQRRALFTGLVRLSFTHQLRQYEFSAKLCPPAAVSGRAVAQFTGVIQSPALFKDILDVASVPSSSVIHTLGRTSILDCFPLTFEPDTDELHATGLQPGCLRERNHAATTTDISRTQQLQRWLRLPVWAARRSQRTTVADVAGLRPPVAGILVLQLPLSATAAEHIRPTAQPWIRLHRLVGYARSRVIRDPIPAPPLQLAIAVIVCRDTIRRPDQREQPWGLWK